jgi:ATP-binding cassette subfamily C exporter for protease/lipase
MSTPVRSPHSSELRLALLDLTPSLRRAMWFSLACCVLVLAPSWYMLEVYDRVVNSANAMTLAMLTVAVLFLYVMMEVLEWARTDVMFAAACRFDTAMTRRVFGAAFEATRKSLPGAGTQAMNDLRTVRDFLHSPVLMAAMDAPLSLLFLVLIFAISPVLGVVALGVAIVQVAIAWLNRRSTREALLGANQHGAAAQQQADRLQAHALVIDVLGMYGVLRHRWRGKQSEATLLQAEASRRGGGYQAVSKMLQNVVNSALLGLSCWLLLHDQLNGGSAMLVIAGILGGRVLAPFIQIVTQWQTVAAAIEAYARLDGVLKAVPVAAPGMPLPAPRGMLTAEQVVAAAPGSSTPIIKGVAFALQPGEVAVVMGPSGSGKSSLARLLLGLWPAASGKVRLDGNDVFAWPRAELGPHLGYLPQAVELVDGTVAENICRFGPVDPAALQDAIRCAGLDDLIASLPQGARTQVGPNGNALSGGQRQRIGLARALYGKPALVVLDEPNSSLDDAGDAALVQAILEHKARGCTFVIMSHRANVLAVADQILLLRDGQQAGFGPRDEVLAAIRRANAPAPVEPVRPLATAKG